MGSVEPVEHEVVRVSGADRRPAGGPDLTFLRGLIDGMRCGVLSIDVEGRLVLLNDHARRILDLAEVPAEGTPLWQALSGYPGIVHALSSSFDVASPPNRAEMVLGRDSHTGKSIGFTVSLVRGDAGEPRGAAMFFKDLTPIEHREEQERLKDRLAALGQMAASMAHEIRNPLAAIDVQCKLLERRIGDAPGCRELLQRITSEVKRLNHSVDSCLDYVRPVSPQLTPADVNAMIDEAIEVARGRHGADRVEIRRDYADLDPFLMDRTLMRQVFVNLMLNAMEAADTGGCVTVETERICASSGDNVPYQPAGAHGDPWGEAEHFVVVRVRDNGPGIDDDVRDRIFHPFFTTKEHGSGVGLAVAKKIVGSHRGMIGVSSALEEGAEIVVRLPMVAAERGGPGT